MTMQPEAPEAPETEGRSGLSRRTVIKAGAHAAWMVPAITFVTAAPAIAQSGSKILITGTTGQWSGTTFTVKVTLENQGGQPTTQVTFTFTATKPGSGNGDKWGQISVPKGSVWTVSGSPDKTTGEMIATVATTFPITAGTTTSVTLTLTAPGVQSPSTQYAATNVKDNY